MEILSVFQKLCSDAQVKVFGKCCQLKPGGDSSSSLDSSVTSSSDIKDQCLKYQVRSLMSFIYSFINIFEHHPMNCGDIIAISPYLPRACIEAGETDK